MDAASNLAVTTSRRDWPDDLVLAERAAAELGVPLVPRSGRTVTRLLRDEGLSGVVVAGDGRLIWREVEGGAFFFHPNMAVGRLRAAAGGGANDPLVRAMGLREGDRVLDATLGLGADAIVASHLVGERGLVLGIEASPVVACLVRHGLATYQHRLAPAMRRVRVVCGDHRALLDGWPAAMAWEVIAFDPMFERTIDRSHGIEGLRRLADYRPLAPAAVARARMLVSRAVVVKGRPDEGWFQALGADEVVPSGRGRVAYAVLRPTS